MNLRRTIDSWIILSVFIVIILIAINIPYTTQEASTVMEYYTEREPYTTTEIYYEKVPFTDEEQLDINTTVDWYITDNLVKDKFDLTATIKNNDTIDGEFWVTFYVESTGGSYNFTSDRVSLKPGESYQFEQTFDGRFSYTTYRVHQPTIEVTKYRGVPEDRTVTKYRNVEKSREVVRVKEVRLSFLERILGKEDNRQVSSPQPRVTEEEDY